MILLKKIFISFFILSIVFNAFPQANDSVYFIPKNKNAGNNYARRRAAREAMETGNLAYDKNYFQGAIKSYDEAIEVDPSLFQAYYGRARAKEQMNDLRSALMDYDVVLHLNPRFSEGYFNRGKLKIRLGEYLAAIEDLNQILDLPPASSNTIYFEGVSESEKEIPTLTKISTVSKEHAEVYNYIGVAKAELEDYRGAMAAFDKAIELKPDLATFYLNRGDLKYKIEQVESAIRDYEKVLQLNPENKEAFYKIVNYKRSTSANDSIEYNFYNNSIDKGINLTSAYLSRAVIKYNRSDFKGALADYNSAIELDNKNHEAYVNRGLVKEKLKDYEEAIKDFTRAIAIRPDYWKAYSNRGNSKFKLDRFAESVPDYSAAIRLNPKDATLFYNRGLAEYLSKQSTEACKDWQKAFEMGYVEAAEKIKEFCEDN
ncbi:MAG TPA: tetratricopeptide repeat protein [Cytophagales bacterium]|nr:tetratricopeptide repeat protein [Cytophagales bacterium]